MTKNEVLDALSVLYNHVSRSAILALENEREEEGDLLEQQKKAVKQYVDQLLNLAFETWSKEAESVRDELNHFNNEIKAALAELEHEKQVVENIVKIIGKVDEALTAVKKYVPQLSF